MDWKRYLRQLVSCLIPAAAAVFLWSCNEAEPQNDAGFRQISCEKELFRLTRRTLKKEIVRLDFMIPEKKMRFTAAPAGSPAALWNDYLQFGKNVYDPNEYNRCIGRFTAEPETFYSDLTFRTWKKRCETEYQILSGHSIAWILKISRRRRLVCCLYAAGGNTGPKQDPDPAERTPSVCAAAPRLVADRN